MAPELDRSAGQEPGGYATTRSHAVPSSPRRALTTVCPRAGFAGRGRSEDTRHRALAHISPAHSENINFFGTIDVDIDGELAQLDPSGYRPLRLRDTLFRSCRKRTLERER